tara:strand:- start:87 stop:635 length:549 start_codon:yes stop_codon:yes gene_type:complete
MSRQDVEFIANTIREMLRDIKPEQIKVILESANQYATVLKFNKDKSYWTNEQLDRYLNFIEKSITLPDLTEEEDVVERVSSIMGDVEDITPGMDKAGDIINKVVDKVEERKKYREDLTCPWCKAKVYDNRNNKKTERSPDFVCATNDPAVCGGHTGKWRKSWWLNSSDIPTEWGIKSDEVPF